MSVAKQRLVDFISVLVEPLRYHRACDHRLVAQCLNQQGNEINKTLLINGNVSVVALVGSKFTQTHPVSYPMGTGALSPGVRRQEREADHSPPTSAEVKKTCIYTSTPP
jgi:hypothetical protein